MTLLYTLIILFGLSLFGPSLYAFDNSSQMYVLEDDFSSESYSRYNLQRLVSSVIAIDTVNQTNLVSQMVDAINNHADYSVIQTFLDYGVDTCERAVKLAKKSWSYHFNLNIIDYGNRLRCYPIVFPIPYNLRIPCPPILLEAVQDRDIEYVNKVLSKYPEYATCGEGLETLLHQPSNPIWAWHGFTWSINPIDLEMAELLLSYGAHVHAPDRYGNPTWIDRTCSKKYHSYCDLDGEKPLGNLLAISGSWYFDWFS